MKLKIKQTTLIEHLNYVIRGISNKNIHPILNCIKFDLTDEGLYLMSTDNEISIKTLITTNQITQIIELGQIVVSGRYIYDIIRKMPDEEITLEEVIGAKLYITTKQSSFTLNCNTPSEYPDLELDYKDDPIILNQKTFKTIVNQTAFASSPGESRPVLTGLNFDIEGTTLKCTATDSYRLAIKTLTLSTPATTKSNIIIPTKNIQELTKMLTEDEEPIELHIFNNKIIFKFNTIDMMSRLISGTYPDTSKLIPDQFNQIVTTNLSDFYGAIDRASLLSSDTEKNTINLKTIKDQMIISSNIPEIGNVEETLNITKSSEEEVKISFNAKYMMDAIRVFESEDIEILLNGDIKPIIIKSKETGDLIQLILPIRTY